MVCMLKAYLHLLLLLLLIIMAVISIASCLTDKNDHTAIYKINNNVFIKIKKYSII